MGNWGYFTEKPDLAALMLLSVAFGAGEFAISEVPETDWVAKVKRELQPVVAGQFFVYGSHDADKVPADCEPLLIEAAMALARDIMVQHWDVYVRWIVWRGRGMLGKTWPTLAVERLFWPWRQRAFGLTR